MFLVAVIGNMMKADMRMKVIVAYNMRGNMRGKHGSGNVRWLVTLHPQGNKEMNAGPQLASPFLFSLRSQATESCCPYLGWIFPPQFNPI